MPTNIYLKTLLFTFLKNKKGHSFAKKSRFSLLTVRRLNLDFFAMKISLRNFEAFQYETVVKMAIYFDTHIFKTFNTK